MRVVVFLLVGAVLGFAVGRVTAPGVGGRGGERRATIPPPDDRAPAMAENVRAEPTPTAREVEAAATSAEVVLPSEPSEDQDRGTLVVDMAGVSGDRDVWVGRLDILGGFELDLGGEWSEGDVVGHVTEPGTYDVWWLDAQGRRLGTRVRLEAGKVTCVRAADHRTAAPIPRGLGVLTVFVQAAGGGGLSTKIGIRGGRRDLPVWTNALGYGSTVIRPGSYSVTVGGHRPWTPPPPREVVVEEGRTTSLRIAHEREGDLVLVADRPLDISVYPVGGRLHSSAILLFDNESDWTPDAAGSGTTRSLPYLPEGEYEVHIPFSLGVPIARFNVRAGQLTRVRCELPKGGVRVRLTVPEGCLPYVEVELRRAEPIAGHPATSMNAAAGEPVEVVLTPGRYRVTARYCGAEEEEGAAPAAEASTDIDVQDRMVDVALELPRPR